MNILIIDDDDDIREILGMILRAEGHGVDEAANGLAAWRRLETGTPPDLLLLDLMMPGLDGERLMRSLRSDARLARVRTVVVSGHRLAREKAAALGAADCLVKPIELDELRRVVARQGGSEAQLERGEPPPP